MKGTNAATLSSRATEIPLHHPLPPCLSSSLPPGPPPPPSSPSRRRRPHPVSQHPPRSSHLRRSWRLRPAPANQMWRLRRPVRGPSGQNISVPYTCPPAQAVYIAALTATILTGHVPNHTGLAVTFPLGDIAQDAYARVTVAEPRWRGHCAPTLEYNPWCACGGARRHRMTLVSCVDRYHCIHMQAISSLIWSASAPDDIVLRAEQITSLLSISQFVQRRISYRHEPC
jgi:hypothetical protein